MKLIIEIAQDNMTLNRAIEVDIINRIGLDGRSAYQIAIDNNIFEGTEQEYGNYPIEQGNLAREAMTTALAAAQTALNTASGINDTISKANAATADAIAATQRVQSSIDNVAQKADAAQSAANLANEKAVLAGNKALMAENATNSASEGSEYAILKGDYAKEQGDYARQAADDIKTSLLNVTLTQTNATNTAYAITKANFDTVAAAVESGLPVSVKITDNRGAAYKIIDLSGIYPAKWNTTLSQIEVSDPNVARGFYLDGATPGTAPKSRGCVTTDTPTYLETFNSPFNSTIVQALTFDSIKGLYIDSNNIEYTEQEVRTVYNTCVNPSASEDQYSYGIEWDVTVSSPLCTRIGNMSLHRTLPIQSAMRGCLLSDDGTVVEYLAPSNWNAHTRDGSAGQVMVEIPAHYRKFTTEGNKRTARISEYPLLGYHLVPKNYISAYEATLDRTTNKLCSVVNMSPQFRGGTNIAGRDDTYRSLLGRPVTALSRTSFRNAARARGAGSQWNCLVYNSYKVVFWLYYIEYANLNCQTAFNGSKDANGYAQGGLGNGVTTLSAISWGEYNGQLPFVPCGHSDGLGNASGEVVYTLPNAAGDPFATVYVPRYRGIENPFGHIWKFTDGINIEVKTSADGGTSKVYVADNPTDFNDINYNGYTMRGLEIRSDGYIKEMILGTYGEIIPALIGGGSTTYWCDYHYSNFGVSSLRGVLTGCYASSSGSGGLGCTSSGSEPSVVSAISGSRLCFIPQV